jgi:rhamnosyltransferase
MVLNTRSGFMQTPAITIVMNVNNERATLEMSLPRLYQQKNTPPWELIVIDSGSTDGSDRLVQRYVDRYPNIRFHKIKPDDFHHARTRNLGLQQARGEIVVFLAGDALPADETWLSSLTAPLDSDDRVAGVYGRQLPRDDADTFNRLRSEWNYPEKPLVKSQKSPTSLSPKERAFFSTVNCCVHLGRTGPVRFDDTLSVNEDVGLSWRLLSEGWKLAYSPDAAVIHSHNRRPLELLRRYFDNAVTYRRIGIQVKAGPSFLRDSSGFGLFVVRRLRGKGVWSWFVVGLYMFAGGAGLILGRLAPLMPRPLVRWISAHGVDTR